MKIYINFMSRLKEVKYQVPGTQKQCLKRKPIHKDDQTEIFISITLQDIFFSPSPIIKVSLNFSSKQVNMVYNSIQIYKYTISNFSLGITIIFLENSFSIRLFFCILALSLCNAETARHVYICFDVNLLKT